MNREELAWAAGLFDGEGSISAHKNQRGYVSPVLQITQVDRQVLDRFHAAVLNIGNVTGPYKRKLSLGIKRRKPQFVYQAAGGQSAQAVVAMIFSFLSPIKKEQVKQVLKHWRHQSLPSQKSRLVPGRTRRDPVPTVSSTDGGFVSSLG